MSRICWGSRKFARRTSFATGDALSLLWASDSWAAVWARYTNLVEEEYSEVDYCWVERYPSPPIGRGSYWRTWETAYRRYELWRERGLWQLILENVGRGNVTWTRSPKGII